jgi:hypothetical protein
MDEPIDRNAETADHGFARRRFLTTAGGAALAVGVGGLLAGCNGSNGQGGQYQSGQHHWQQQ